MFSAAQSITKMAWGLGWILILASSLASSLAWSSASGAGAFPIIALTWTTRDHQTIFSELHVSPQLPNQVIVVSPGFSQNLKTPTEIALCSSLTQFSNVICMEFRGTGSSSGRFTFGKNEYLDLEPILKWAHAHYDRVILLGFSVGAYTATRAAAEFGENLDRLGLISVPTSVDEIVASGDWTRNAYDTFTRPDLRDQQQPQDWLFRWGPPFGDEPSAADFAKMIDVPASFLVGGKDDLVPASMSREVENAYAGPKSWTEIPNGEHAEDMFNEQRSEFLTWVRNQFF